MPLSKGTPRSLTSLGRAEVLARCWSPRAASPSFLNAQSTTFNVLTLKSLLGCIRLLGSDHLDETEATRLLGVRIFHNRASFYITILLEQARHISLIETRMDAGNEEIRAGVASS